MEPKPTNEPQNSTDSTNHATSLHSRIVQPIARPADSESDASATVSPVQSSSEPSAAVAAELAKMDSEPQTPQQAVVSSDPVPTSATQSAPAEPTPTTTGHTPELTATVVSPVVDSPAPYETPTPAPVTTSSETPPQSAPAKQKRLLKPVLAAVAAVLVITVGSAAAYVGMVLPNKPENAVPLALLHSIQQKQTTFSGDLGFSSSGIATKNDFTGSLDTAAKSFQTKTSTSVSGVSLDTEIRYVNKNAYIKVGDLSQIATLAGTLSPEFEQYIGGVNKLIANKWVEVDSTLLKEVGLSCPLEADTTLSKSDLALVKKLYLKNKFVTVQSATSDVVNGQKVKKYEILVNDDKFAEAANGASNLGIVKKLSACDTEKDKSTKPLKGDHDNTPITLWINKSREIVQVASKSTAADKKKGIDGEGKITIQYKATPVEKPSDTVPFMTVMAELSKQSGTQGLDSLLSGSGASDETIQTLNSKLPLNTPTAPQQRSAMTQSLSGQQSTIR